MEELVFYNGYDWPKSDAIILEKLDSKQDLTPDELSRVYGWLGYFHSGVKTKIGKTTLALIYNSNGSKYK